MLAPSGDDDGFLGFDGAGVFAGAATDAEFGVHFGQTQIFAVRLGEDGFGGAMFGACGAICAVGDHDAEFANKFRLADLDGLFGGEVEQADCAVGTNLAAAAALEVAERTGEVEVRFQEAKQAVFKRGRLKNASGTRADAEVARGAAVEELFDATRTGRGDWC